VNLHIRVVRPGHLAVDLVKLVVCAIVFTHGIHRYLYGEIGPLGRALASFGFPFPLVEAHLVNLAETGGVLLIALGVLVPAMCAVLIVIFATGIALIHWHLGFFIVEPARAAGSSAPCSLPALPPSPSITGPASPAPRSGWRRAGRARTTAFDELFVKA